MKHGWDDVLHFLFNAACILAVLGLLFLVKLLFDFIRWLL